MIIAIVLVPVAMCSYRLGTSIDAGDRAATAFSSSPISAPASDPTPLQLISQRFNLEGQYFYLRGQVKNVGASKLDSVLAVGEFYDKNGVLVKPGEALVDFNPIVPGQTTPFSVMSSYNPEIKTATLNFKTMFGGSIDYADATTKK